MRRSRRRPRPRRARGKGRGATFRSAVPPGGPADDAPHGDGGPVLGAPRPSPHLRGAGGLAQASEPRASAAPDDEPRRDADHVEPDVAGRACRRRSRRGRPVPLVEGSGMTPIGWDGSGPRPVGVIWAARAWCWGRRSSTASGPSIRPSSRRRERRGPAARADGPGGLASRAAEAWGRGGRGPSRPRCASGRCGWCGSIAGRTARGGGDPRGRGRDRVRRGDAREPGREVRAQ